MLPIWLSWKILSLKRVWTSDLDPLTKEVSVWLLRKSQNKVSSRKQIAIKEVRDGVLVLPNSQYRLILETSSVNFELKSEAEQDVIIESFQNFLNSVTTKLQILIRVRELDIDSYVENIMISKDKESKKIYKSQINNYAEFIQNLVTGNKILSRKFYIVIPYNPQDKKEDFYFAKEQLIQARDLVVKGLERMGMKARQIESLEILDLFYSFYNKSQIKTQELQGQTIELLLNKKYV